MIWAAWKYLLAPSLKSRFLGGPGGAEGEGERVVNGKHQRVLFLHFLMSNSEIRNNYFLSIYLILEPNVSCGRLRVSFSLSVSPFLSLFYLVFLSCSMFPPPPISFIYSSFFFLNFFNTIIIITIIFNSKFFLNIGGEYFLFAA